MIEFGCLKCNQKFAVPDTYSGKKVRCKRCGTVCIVEAAREDEQTPTDHGDQLLASILELDAMADASGVAEVATPNWDQLAIMPSNSSASSPQTKLFSAVAGAAIFIVVFVAAYFVIFRDTWEQDHRQQLLFLVSDARAEDKNGNQKEAIAACEELLALVNGKSIEDAQLNKEITQARKILERNRRRDSLMQIRQEAVRRFENGHVKEAIAFYDNFILGEKDATENGDEILLASIKQAKSERAKIQDVWNRFWSQVEDNRLSPDSADDLVKASGIYMSYQIGLVKNEAILKLIDASKFIGSDIDQLRQETTDRIATIQAYIAQSKREKEQKQLTEKRKLEEQLLLAKQLELKKQQLLAEQAQIDANKQKEFQSALRSARTWRNQILSAWQSELSGLPTTTQIIRAYKKRGQSGAEISDARKRVEKKRSELEHLMSKLDSFDDYSLVSVHRKILEEEREQARQRAVELARRYAEEARRNPSRPTNTGYPRLCPACGGSGKRINTATGRMRKLTGSQTCLTCEGTGRR